MDIQEKPLTWYMTDEAPLYQYSKSPYDLWVQGVAPQLKCVITSNEHGNTFEITLPWVESWDPATFLRNTGAIAVNAKARIDGRLDNFERYAFILHSIMQDLAYKKHFIQTFTNKGPKSFTQRSLQYFKNIFDIPTQPSYETLVRVFKKLPAIRLRASVTQRLKNIQNRSLAEETTERVQSHMPVMHPVLPSLDILPTIIRERELSHSNGQDAEESSEKEM